MKFSRYMLSCKEASRLVSQSCDRSISLREHWALGFHLMICKFCRRFSRQLAQINRAIRRLAVQTEQDESLQLAPEARQRIAVLLESRQGSHAYNNEQQPPRTK
jgi:predicted anti-sigma-YlaC factor YlaD